MRALVVADIHGNWEALRAVVACEQADRIFCLGDIVGYGPQPFEVLRWMDEHAHVMVCGDHDAAVGFGRPLQSADLRDSVSEEIRNRTTFMLPSSALRRLAGLPICSQVELDGLQIAILHATPMDPLTGNLLAMDLVAWREAVADLHADMLLVGHTHIPAIVDLGQVTVVNPGSIGLPRNGDPRAHYAVLEDGRPMLKRASYDIASVLEPLEQWGLSERATRILTKWYQTGEMTSEEH